MVNTIRNLEAKTGTSALDTIVRASIALGLADNFEAFRLRARRRFTVKKLLVRYRRSTLHAGIYLHREC
jgi:hypothetical protein